MASDGIKKTVIQPSKQSKQVKIFLGKEKKPAS